MNSDINDELFKYNRLELNNILDEQIIITRLSKGITFEDTNNMDTYERRYIIEKLINMENEEYEAKAKAIEEAKNKNR